MTDPAHYAIETPGAAITAIVRLDAPAPRIPISGAPRELRWDATHFYAITGNSVVRLPRAGTATPEVLASARMLGELVLVGDRLVWAEPSTLHLAGGPTGRPGQVTTIPRGGGTPEALVSDIDPRSLAVSGDRIYFSNGDAIERVDAKGGARTVLVPHTGTTPLLRSDGRWLYFTRQSGVSRVDDAGHIEIVADEIEIPIGIALDGGDVVILANAVINRPRPEYARPARLLRVAPGGPARVLWSQPDALVGGLEVHAGRARFAQRALTTLEPTVVEIALDDRR